MKERSVVCTNRGQHGRIELTRISVDLDEHDTEVVIERPVRHRPLRSDDGKITFEGEEYDATKYVDIAPATQVSKIRGQWRWKCPKCNRDRPLTEENLLRWMHATPSAALDISLLPR